MSDMNERETVPFAREQRLRFIEALALWEGAVQRKRVSQVFGIAENHVTKDLKAYEKRNPQNLRFDPRARAYVPCSTFKPEYISDDPAEYLSLLQAHAESGSTAVLPELGGEGVAAETLPAPGHGIDRAVFRHAVRAIRRQRGFVVTYLSMTADRPVRRTLWPHALVHTGFRWQVRAYDSHRNAFRDFVLQRMSKPDEIDRPSPQPVANDVEWSTWEHAEVVPHPGLTEHQKFVIAKEFGMKQIHGEYVWQVELRCCVVGYFARKYGFDLNRVPDNPSQFPVILRNWDALSPYFFPSNENAD